MKTFLTNVDLFHPEENINLKNTSVLLDGGVITKIGELNKDEIEGAKEFDFSGKLAPQSARGSAPQGSGRGRAI